MAASTAADPGLEGLHANLIDRLEATTPLQRGEVVRIVGDVLDYFAEDVDDLVRRRHRELAAQRLTNAVIFPRIRRELPLHRVTAPDLSLRQLRRIVYG